MKKLSALFVACALLVSGCSDNSTGPPMSGGQSQGGALSFRNDILPIFSNNRCTSCHGGTSGLTVTSVASLLQGGDHGPAIIAGNSDSSILVQKISPNPPFGSRMPFGGPYLPDATISTIKKWIDEGAKDN